MRDCGGCEIISHSQMLTNKQFYQTLGTTISPIATMCRSRNSDPTTKTPDKTQNQSQNDNLCVTRQMYFSQTTLASSNLIIKNVFEGNDGIGRRINLPS